MKISAVVHTCNSEETLEKALQSIAWADETIVVDMQSVDRTLEIARNFTDRIFTAPKRPRVDGIRNEYNAKATNEWILVLDSDESLPADAKEEIEALIDKHGKRYDAFAIPRLNYIAGQIMKGTGWYPDHQIRLFRKETVQWQDAIHVPPEISTGKHKLYELVPPHCLHIHHFNYRDLRHFIQKQMEYALNQCYPPDFDFARYIAEAHEQLAREDRNLDGDLSHALSLLMACDSVVRGLIHWDSLQPRPPLGSGAELFSNNRDTRVSIKKRTWLAEHASFHYFVRRFREKFRSLFMKRKIS
ncbi:MAG: glycosyl transferase family 2 [Acidobacteria bacterium]|nr:MAG: glycosyl transferase family 2 [Acidobacteriota bacterium]